MEGTLARGHGCQRDSRCPLGSALRLRLAGVQTDRPHGETPVCLFAEHCLQIFPPTFVDPQKFPFDLRGDIVQQRVGRRMYVQCRRDQEKQGLSVTQFNPGKVSEAMKLATGMVPGHAGPVVQTLHGQVDVFICLEFDHRQTVRAGHRKDVNHGAV